MIFETAQWPTLLFLCVVLGANGGGHLVFERAQWLTQFILCVVLGASGGTLGI